MGLTTKKYFRRLLYVKILLLVMLGVSLAVGGMLWSFPTDLGEGYHNGQAVLRAIQKVLVWRVVLYCAVTFIFIMPAIVWLLLFYSHRIAGPTHRVGLEAAKIGAGNLVGGIAFRQHDSLTDMADSLNDLVFWYRDRIDSVQLSLSVIDEQSNNICDLVLQGDDSGACIKNAAEQISKNVLAIGSCLQEIRT
jgi:methyl-accepting chemotaxis protein